MTLNIQTYELKKSGRKIYYMALGKAKGKKALLTEGFTQSRNPNYYRKGNTIAHFNQKMGVWRIEYTEDEATTEVR